MSDLSPGAVEHFMPVAQVLGAIVLLLLAVGGGFGAATAAPKNFTIPAGLWSGAGCSLKTCVEMYGSDSMPNACR